jgi:hypothetical protein
LVEGDVQVIGSVGEPGFKSIVVAGQDMVLLRQVWVGCGLWVDQRASRLIKCLMGAQWGITRLHFRTSKIFW